VERGIRDWLKIIKHMTTTKKITGSPKKAIPAHAFFAKMLKESRGLPSLDNTAKYNTIYAIQIERRIREEISRVEGIGINNIQQRDIIKAFATLLTLLDKDEWIRKNATDLGFIYRNFGRILK
jgi:hypothetical protein